MMRGGWSLFSLLNGLANVLPQRSEAGEWHTTRTSTYTSSAKPASAVRHWRPADQECLTFAGRGKRARLPLKLG
jgi:hypothetical protein